MSHCYNLNINIEPIVGDVDKVLHDQLPYHSTIEVENINPEMNDFLRRRGLTLFFIEVFHAVPNMVTGIHIDKSGGDYTKINYVYNGKDSLMNWYSVKENVHKSVGDSLIGTPMIPYKSHEVDLVQQANLGFPSLVQVGVPHNVNNFEEHRYCVSLVYRNNATRTRPTMQQSIEIFNDCLA